MPEFFHPVVYLGDKPEKTITINRAIVFRPGVDFDKPYAYVTEEEAQHLIKRHGSMFALPEGPQGHMRALQERVQVLEMALADVAKRLDSLEAPKVKRKGGDDV